MSTTIETENSGYKLPRILLAFIGLTLATSSVVYIEPAPYDILIIVLFGVSLLCRIKFPREMQVAVVLLCIFILANILAALLSNDPATTIRNLSVRVYLVLTWILFVALIAFDPLKVSSVVWKGYLLAAVIALAWGCLEYFGFFRSDIWVGGLRAKGPFKDPNVFAPFLIPMAIYCLKGVYEPGRRSAKTFFAVFFILFAFGILIGFSRGAWLAFIISFCVFSFLHLAFVESHEKRLKLILANFLLLFVCVGVLSVAVTTTSVAERFLQRAVITQDYDLREGGRFYTQLRSLEVIGESPLGIGPGRSNLELGLQPHNLYLHIFLESGWVGGFVFFVFLFYTLYRAMPLLHWPSALRGDVFVILACLTGLLLQSLFIDSTHWRHFWLLLALMWGAIIVHERRKCGIHRELCL